MLRTKGEGKELQPSGSDGASEHYPSFSLLSLASFCLFLHSLFKCLICCSDPGQETSTTMASFK